MPAILFPVNFRAAYPVIITRSKPIKPGVFCCKNELFRPFYASFKGRVFPINADWTDVSVGKLDNS
jgi:hypothetical protein